MKAFLRGKFSAVDAHIRKTEQVQINKLMRNLTWEKKKQPQAEIKKGKYKDESGNP